jgi:hypothetical protein
MPNVGTADLALLLEALVLACERLTSPGELVSCTHSATMAT